MPILKTGDIFAGCRIIDICGHGGFGTVYLAENAVGDKVAVKIVNAHDREAELKGIRCYMEAAPRSPYLLPIFHVGIERDMLFYCMAAADPLDGDSPRYIADTLGRRLKLRGRLKPEDALEITRKIAQAVEQLHRAGLIHRDIKPDNIIFVGGEPMLSDPGLIHPLDCSASLAGTLGFLPPECFSGEENNSIGSDIYALGKVFYCAFSGENPGHYPRLPRDLGAALCRKLLPILLKACNEKKEKRYADIGELLRALPEKLPSPGPLERFGEAFRIWRLMHAKVWYSILTALLLLFLLCGYGAYETMRRHRQAERERAAMAAAAERERAAMTAATENLHKRFADGGERLRLQLIRALGESEADALCRSADRVPERPAAAIAYCREIDRKLEHAARALAAAAWKIDDPLRRSGEVRALLDSPLGRCLSDAERKELEGKLADDENKHGLIRPWQPSPGRIYYPDSSRSFEFVYVPPGEFVSPRTKKIVRIDYPMWVGATELSVLQFSRICNFIPAGSRDLYMPATRIVWNDLISGCRHADRLFRRIAPLPPGYIVRPLTEDEWEYCALAGMRDTPPRTDSAAVPGERPNGPALPGRGRANSFGLYDMTGNVREAVLAERRGNPGSYVLRGSGWRNDPRHDPLTLRTEVAFYQSFMTDSGTRLAIAPGTPELYDREFRCREDRHLRFGGRHYEFFGHLCADFTPEDARNICALLGGRPAKLDDPALVKKLLADSSPVMRYPVLVDAEFSDGCWRWRDGTPLSPAPPAPDPGEIMLIMEWGKFKPSRMRAALGFVCEWSDAEWAARRDPRTPERRRLIVAEFTLGGTKYALINVYGYPHLARRYAEILGGRLAEPKSPELRRQLAEKLGDHVAIPAFVGGIRKFERYRWISDGQLIDGDLRLVGLAPDNAPSLATPVLVDGELRAAQLARGLLVEFPPAPAK